MVNSVVAGFDPAVVDGDVPGDAEDEDEPEVPLPLPPAQREDSSPTG